MIITWKGYYSNHDKWELNVLSHAFTPLQVGNDTLDWFYKFIKRNILKAFFPTPKLTCKKLCILEKHAVFVTTTSALECFLISSAYNCELLQPRAQVQARQEEDKKTKKDVGCW